MRPFVWQALVFFALLVLQGLAALASALGCGDDGPVDGGTATALQERYCDAIPSDEEAFLLLFSSPLLVFSVANGLTRVRSRWKPLLGALPFVAVTGVFPVALWVNWT